MDAAERALLDATVRDAMERAPASARGDDELAALGWLEMLSVETRAAITVVFTALGATNRSASVLDDVMVNALGDEPSPDVAFLLPQFAAWGVPGRFDAGTASARGLATVRLDTAPHLAVVCRTGSELRRVVVPATAAHVTPVRGIDPDAGLRAVEVDCTANHAEPLDSAVWDAALGAGRIAVAHQTAGACRAMLELARIHALEREQFGRPVARFQAVRHRLAEALVAVEALEATLTAAWDEAGAMTAALAKASAGRTARTVAAHCQQVLAGIGFTTDHSFHRFLKRTMLLDGLLGSADAITVDLGAQLLATRQVPTLIEL